MMARSTTRSNQRPDTLMQDRICQVDETSCNARPDHTSGSQAAELAPGCELPVCPCEPTCSDTASKEAMGYIRTSWRGHQMRQIYFSASTSGGKACGECTPYAHE